MNKSNVFIFISGLSLGSLVTWRVLKTKYDQMIQEDIEAAREARAKHTESEEKPAEDLEEQKEKAAKALNKKDILDYKSIIAEQGYTDYLGADKKVKERDKEMVSVPYVIDSDEFDESVDYEKESLTYYADHILADDADVVITDVERVVGKDALKNFERFEEDVVFVKNEELNSVYEIASDVRRYSDVAGSEVYPTED